jgi:hypothetical protein
MRGEDGIVSPSLRRRQKRDVVCGRSRAEKREGGDGLLLYIPVKRHMEAIEGKVTCLRKQKLCCCGMDAWSGVGANC